MDTLISGGLVVDGTGVAPYFGDVGIRDGRLSFVEPTATRPHTEWDRVVDATGLIVAPGVVDAHTHYDAQLFWDPTASVSSEHGVTSVIAGHCGFTIAPVRKADIEYILRMLAAVEGMSADALRNGLPWSWTSFADYLDELEGQISVNAAFMVGHSALRRFVMGEAAVGRKASPEQIAEMVRLLHEALAAGGVGLSTTFSPSHVDGDGAPVPSRHATVDEIVALCAAVGEHEGTWLEAAFAGAANDFTREEADLMVAMTAAAKRPLNWNLLTVDAAKRSRVSDHYAIADRARDAGGRVVALTLPVVASMNVNFRTVCTLNHFPGWGPILSLPLPERMETLGRPEVQADMLARATSPEAGVLLSMGVADFENYTVGDVFSEANAGLKGRRISDIAIERGTEPFATVIAIALADGLATYFWPAGRLDDETRAFRRETWNDPRVLIGGSDAGAHLDRTLNSTFPTRFLADVLRGSKPVTVERAVQFMTDDPARLFGLRERGRLQAGYYADVLVFDPETVGAEDPSMVPDFPSGAERLVARSTGIRHVFVNGVETVTDGVPNARPAGKVLRSGRDTTSATMGVGRH